MAYRKFTADQVFDGYKMLAGDQVLITDNNGTLIDILPGTEAGGDVQRFAGTLLPGLINCHCHLELSHMEGMIPPGSGMVDFLLTVMKSRDRFPDDVAGKIASAEKTMADSGVVAVGDVCNTSLTADQKRQGNIRYHSFVEATGFVEAGAGPRFDQAAQVYGHFSGNASIVPHAPYSVSPALMKRIDGCAPASLLTIHNQESQTENEFFQKGRGDLARLYRTLGIDISGFRPSGTTSIQTYLEWFSPDHRLILVHNTVTSRDDIAWIESRRSRLPELYWCLCPNANLYINDMLADVPMLRAAGCTMVVGTDSLASNHELNLVGELRTLQAHFPQLPLTELLQWTTINGARALRMEDRLGSFERGKTPGIVLLENVREGSLAEARAKRIF